MNFPKDDFKIYAFSQEGLVAIASSYAHVALEFDLDHIEQCMGYAERLNSKLNEMPLVKNMTNESEDPGDRDKS